MDLRCPSVSQLSSSCTGPLARSRLASKRAASSPTDPGRVRPRDATGRAPPSAQLQKLERPLVEDRVDQLGRDGWQPDTLAPVVDGPEGLDRLPGGRHRKVRAEEEPVRHAVLDRDLQAVVELPLAMEARREV